VCAIACVIEREKDRECTALIPRAMLHKKKEKKKISYIV
jgi:hypothetical protein